MIIKSIAEGKFTEALKEVESSLNEKIKERLQETKKEIASRFFSESKKKDPELGKKMAFGMDPGRNSVVSSRNELINKQYRDERKKKNNSSPFKGGDTKVSAHPNAKTKNIAKKLARDAMKKMIAAKKK